MTNRRSMMGGGAAFLTLLGAPSAFGQSPKQRICTTKNKDITPHFYSKVSGTGPDPDRMTVTRTYVGGEESVKLADGSVPDGDGQSALISVSYRRPEPDSTKLIPTDLGIIVRGFRHHRLISYDMLGGNVGMDLYLGDEKVARLPVHADVYDGDPDTDKPLWMITSLSDGAPGGIMADDEIKADFVARMFERFEQSGEGLTAAVSYSVDGTPGAFAIAFVSFTIDWQGLAYRTHNRLSSEVWKYSNGKC